MKMPKGKRKTKIERKRTEAASIYSDDESLNDTASVISSVSDVRSNCDDGAGAESEETETEQEIFEEKLKEAIDGTTQKSSKGRQNCLEGVAKALSSRYLPEFTSERKETLTDCIKFSLKRGKADEQSAAAVLAVILCIQLGPGEETDRVFEEIRPILLTAMNDNATATKARAKYATTLSMCAFIVGEIEQDVMRTILSSLESLFGASYLKGNRAVPNHTMEVTSLHSSALAAWTLLLTVLQRIEVHAMAESHLTRLCELLESPDVDLRIAAGEAIALLYEVARDHDEDYDGDELDELCVKLKQLATDSQKFRAKKDRKQQRSSFRDILKAVETREAQFVQVKFGQEVLELDNWCRKRQYDAFCNVLGSGMNHHLAENELLREIFELGAPLTPNTATALKMTKFERHQGNVAAFKARTIARNKVRDKRSVILG